MSKLSIERLFEDPPLIPPAPSQLKFSTDGEFITYLHPRKTTTIVSISGAMTSLPVSPNAG